MCAALVQLFFLGWLSVTTALSISHGIEPHFDGALTKRGCEQRYVSFHYNDSSIGSMLSCSHDVMALASRSLAPGERSLSPRQACAPGQCADGLPTNYTVKAGDSLEAIAATYNSGVCDIAIASGIADNPDYILAGQVLTVPTQLCNPDSSSCRKPPGTRACVPRAENPPATLTIVQGNTFYLLGQSYNVTFNAFIAANLCADPGNLAIGQVVNVPVCPECSGSCGGQ